MLGSIPQRQVIRLASRSEKRTGNVVILKSALKSLDIVAFVICYCLACLEILTKRGNDEEERTRGKSKRA
jgi:hypothetical protein